MNSFKILSDDEKNLVKELINSLLQNNEFESLLEQFQLLKIEHHRIEVYLVPLEFIPLINLIKIHLKDNQIIQIGGKLGFFINERFFIGIESLSYLTPLTDRKLILNSQETTKFLYGESFAVADQDKSISYLNSPIIICSDQHIPIGIGILKLKEKICFLKNLVDVGIYLRSEKSAFRIGK